MKESEMCHFGAKPLRANPCFTILSFSTAMATPVFQVVAALSAFQPALLSSLDGVVKELRDGPGFNFPKTVILCLFSAFSENIKIASGTSLPSI